MIYAHNIWKKYQTIQVLKGLTLSVPDGKIMIILGRSGVGKSVLLRQIAGLEMPDSGYIEVNGARISELSQRELYQTLRQLGMLFQSSALFDSLTVGENVAFYLKEHHARVALSELEDRVEESLAKVGLSGFQKKMPSELSGGQKRRAALARLIIYKPKIILYDEPTTGLDPVTAAQINELISQTHTELNATTIIVTHDIKSALFLGDLFAIHHEGAFASVDEKEHFLQSDNPLIREFLNNAFVDQKYVSLFQTFKRDINHHA